MSAPSIARPPALSIGRPASGSNPWASAANSQGKKKKSASSTTVDVPVDPSKNYFDRLPDEVLIYILAQLDPFDLVFHILLETQMTQENLK
jgi:hypothetical protein